MLVREFLACSEVGASRAVRSKTIDTNIRRSDVNLRLQNLAASGIGLNSINDRGHCVLHDRGLHEGFGELQGLG